ncbi:MAG: regulatory protein RecX [Oscillospiraceae bacterium]|nr:regulatory protein RecX [Oscillospiraceae bacterium]
MDESAKKRALALLEKRDYSRKMLLDKLTEKGTSPEAAAEVCDRLCELGVVDDARYAALVTRHYAARGYGARRIRDELFRRGIPRELWDEAMAELPDADDTADRLLRQKLRGWDGDEAALQRAQNYLLRRGFSWEEIRGALERYRSENEDLI